MLKVLDIKLLTQRLYAQFSTVPYSRTGFSDFMVSINPQIKENAALCFLKQEWIGLFHVRWGSIWQRNSIKGRNSQALLAFRVIVFYHWCKWIGMGIQRERGFELNHVRRQRRQYYWILWVTTGNTLLM